MQQIKTLLIKEYRTHKHVFLIPAYFLAGTYAFILIAVLIGWAKMGSISTGINLQAVDPHSIATGIWEANFISSMILVWAAIIAGAGLVDNLLNQDYAKKCEIFHLSQPVSLIKIASVKVLFLYGCELAFTLGLVLINSIVIGLLLTFLGFPGPFSGTFAAVQGFIAASITYVALVSIKWFFGCLGKTKSGLIMVMTILGIIIALEILGHFTQMDFYGPLDYIMGSIVKPTGLFVGGLGNPPELKVQAWSAIFSLGTLFRFLVSAVLITLGYFLYQRREVS